MTKRILLADDEAHVLRLMKLRLEREGYAVDCAGNGAQALDQIRTCMPDALVTDIQMPRMNGRELCERIHQEFPSTGLVIFVATSRAELEHREWTQSLPAVHFLEKPISLNGLVEALRSRLTASDGNAA